MKKAYFLIVLFLCGLSVGNLFAAASAAAAAALEDDLGQELINAARKGDKAKVEDLIARGVEVNAQDLAGWTALMSAANNDHTDIVNLLLDEGAMVNAVALGRYTALMLAAKRGNTDIVQMLLRAGADKSIRNLNRETAENLARDARYDGHNELADYIRDYVLPSGRLTKAAR